MHKYLFTFFLASFPWLCFGDDLISEEDCDSFIEQNYVESPVHRKYVYPNFSNNPKLSEHMKKIMAPHLIPFCSLKNILDDLFKSSYVINSEKTLRKAGFTILFSQKRSHIRVIKHPKLHGYLIKLYPNSEKKLLSSGWKRLTIRCIVAKKIKSIIKRCKIRNLVVTDKWLYPLPLTHSRACIQPVVLVVKDMQIYNRHDTSTRWRKHASKRTVKELFQVLSRGYGSAFLSGNIPYTKSGKFAFIDTEYDKRKIPMEHARRFLSTSNRHYWDHLIKNRKFKLCSSFFPCGGERGKRGER